MTTRPTDRWRAVVEQEARDLASGALAPECAGMAEHYAEPLLSATDAALEPFAPDVAALQDPSDGEVLEAVERVVMRLNRVDEEGHGGGFDTIDREDLCEYIEDVLTGHGIDVPALAARNGMGAHEITDRWRDW